MDEIQKLIERAFGGARSIFANLSPPEGLTDAVRIVDACRGRVVTLGVGKSAYIANKMSSTLSSIGIPAFYVHPGEASHGDLGMITPEDVLIFFSKSGESRELQDALSWGMAYGNKSIALTEAQDSFLAKSVDCLVLLPRHRELLDLPAPTVSALLQMFFADTIAVVAATLRGFREDDFHFRHPGGALGAQFTKAEEVMHSPPLVQDSASIGEALKVLDVGGFGTVGILANKKLVGVVTDGDLRRHFGESRELPVTSIMTRNPVLTQKNAILVEVARLLRQSKIQAVFVIDENDACVGIVHVQDLLKKNILL